MVQCFVPHCNHRSDDPRRPSSCRVNVKFPTGNLYRRKKWIDAVRRKDQLPNDTSVLCTCHFRGGNTEQTPSIFEWSKSTVFKSPERRRRRTTKEHEPVCRTYARNNVLDTEAGTNQVLYTSTAAQTEHHFGPQFYESERYFLEKKIEDLTKEITNLKCRNFGFYSIANNDRACLHYTGLHLDMFNILTNMCKNVKFNYCTGKRVLKLELRDQLFITLMKLRINSSFLDLSIRFGVSETTVINIVNTFIEILHTLLFQQMMANIPSQNKNQLSLPSCFSTFPNCRIVLDCTEFSCAVPSDVLKKEKIFSTYKHNYTVKAAIGVAPNCAITYCSDVYPGSTSDKSIIQHCGILEKLEPGDLVVADKGFLISDLLPNGVTLNVPPFLSTPQFTPSQVEETRRIAKARVHVERANYRVKNYKITKFIPATLFPKITKVIQLCCALVNFESPLLKEIERSLSNNDNGGVDENFDLLSEESDDILYDKNENCVAND